MSLEARRSTSLLRNIALKTAAPFGHVFLAAQRYEP